MRSGPVDGWKTRIDAAAEIYVAEVSMGIEGISKSQGSKMAAKLGQQVEQFRSRPLDAAPYQYVWRDARGPVARGLSGIELVISNAHAGLVHAIQSVLLGAQWQRCRTHFMRNLLTRVPKKAQNMVATLVGSVSL